MPNLLNIILGTWAVVAGISLVFTFFKQYRGRARYLYLFFFGMWAGLWGVGALRHQEVATRGMMWLIVLVAVGLMLADSVRRYRETRRRLSEERVARLRGGLSKPPDDPPAG
jgi:peptidoglycan/LPS O-acetylase OafA/YrhL